MPPVVSAKKLFWVFLACLLLIAAWFVLARTGGGGEPTYGGRPLREVVRNPALQPAQLTLEEMLKPRAVRGPEQIQGNATFEVPVSYDAVQKIGIVYLRTQGLEAQAPPSVPWQGLRRATNGNCLIDWDNACYPPGLYKVSVMFCVLRAQSRADSDKVTGFAIDYCSSNLVQFDSDSLIVTGEGAEMHALVYASNADYALEITSNSGRRLKTIRGNSTSGVIDELWDLHDEEGNLWLGGKNFNVIYRVTNAVTGATYWERPR